jgi:hypothetical protein
LRFPFLWWMYGGPAPNGWTVITGSMQRLHSERTPAAICTAAAVDYCTHLAGQKLEPQRSALSVAMEKASGGGVKSPEAFMENEACRDLDPRTLRRLWSYATAATLAACCHRADVYKPDYFKWKSDAQRTSDETAANELARYLDGHFTDTNGQQIGMRRGALVDGLYLPPAKMLDFREVARTAMASASVMQLFKELPSGCVRQWMLKWACPQRYGVATNGTATNLLKTPIDRAAAAPVLGRSEKGTAKIPNRGGRPAGRTAATLAKEKKVEQLINEGWSDITKKLARKAEMQRSELYTFLGDHPILADTLKQNQSARPKNP